MGRVLEGGDYMIGDGMGGVGGGRRNGGGGSGSWRDGSMNIGIGWFFVVF